MNRDEIERMWEEARDGELDPECRESFDEHMIRDRELASLWGAESRWLDSLKQTPVAPTKHGEPSFVDKVLGRFDRQPRPGVLGRIDWRSARFAGSWTAAAAAIALIMVLSQPQENKRSLNTHLVNHPTAAPVQTDPLSVLVHDVTDQYQRKPAEVYNIVRDTPALFSMDRAMRMFAASSPSHSGRRPGEGGAIMRAGGPMQPNR